MKNETVPEDDIKWCSILYKHFNETSDLNPSLPCGIPASVVQRAALMSIFMVVALIGNTVVLTTLYKAKAWRLPVSAFVIALAASDILIALLSMPTELFWEIFGGWLFGNFACKMLTYVQCILFASTSFIHMGISYDRYEAVCKPLVFSERTLRNRWMILTSWISAVLVAIPQLFIFQQVRDIHVVTETGTTFACKSTGYTAEWQRKLYVTWNAVYLFVLPVSFILFCYIKIARVVWKCDKQTEVTYSFNVASATCAADDLIIADNVNKKQCDRKLILSQAKIKTIKVTVWILFLYTFCWTPYFTVSLLNVWSDYYYKSAINASPIAILALCLCWFSSCVNPIIYGCFNVSFHQLQKCIFCHYGRRKPSCRHTSRCANGRFCVNNVMNSNMPAYPMFPVRKVPPRRFFQGSWTHP